MFLSQIRLKATLSLGRSDNFVLSILLNGNYPNARAIVRLHEIKFSVDGRELSGTQESAAGMV